MKRIGAKSTVGITLILLIAVGCKSQSQSRTHLFNGEDFSGWVFVLQDEAVDPATVWSIREGVIHCIGQPYGYMRTETVFADYRLHVEWRWPEVEGNSGIFVHMQEPDQVWPPQIECQLQSGNAGDFVAFQGVSFNELERRVVRKREESSENPLGQWNVGEIVCRNDTIRVFINDVLQNEATGTTISSGRIGLQSEGQPIEFRNVYIDALN